MNILKRFFKESNLIIIIFVFAYSCSTNTIPTGVISFDDPNLKLAEVHVLADRFILAPEMQRYSARARKAERFFKYLVDHPDILTRLTFDYTLDTREIVLIKIKQSEGLIITRVDLYYPVWRFSRTIAYQRSGMIYFNGYRIERDECEMVNTLVHEYLHRLGYGHGDNNSQGKQYSVPYFIGSLAEITCRKGDI